jgi:ABC-type bacteriocin/lantibiotic exporter with double-glycine peptidase domain
VTGVVAIGTAGVLWFGARQVIDGAMTAGALVVFMTYLGKLFRPIQDPATVAALPLPLVPSRSAPPSD